MARNERLNEFMKECMADAYIKLLETKLPHEITVDEIAKTANVGRATYFRYFNGKDEMLLFKLKVLWERWADKYNLTKYEFDLNNAKSFFEFELSIKDLKKLLNKRKLGYISFINFNIILSDNKHSTYKNAFYANGLYGLVEAWIQNDYKDSVEEMVKTLTEIFDKIN